MRVFPLATSSHLRFIRVFLFVLILDPLCSVRAQAQTKPGFQRDYIYDKSGRLILTVEPDLYGPFPPTGVSADFDDSVCEVDVAWNATTDLGGSGVAGYWIYRNTTYVGQTTGLSFVDNYDIRGTYAYTAKGYDHAGNIGPASSPAYAIIKTCSPQAPTKKPPASSSSSISTSSASNHSLLARLGIPGFFRGIRNGMAASFKKMAAFGSDL